jgi:hypothetical protein
LIRIRSKRDKFRRAGVEHPAEPVDYPDDHFTTEQMAAIEAEPMLVVERVPDKKATEKPAGKADDDKTKKGGK